VRRAAILLAVLSACLTVGVAGAAQSSLIVARSTVTALAADGDDVAFSTLRTRVDCDRVFIWQRLSGQMFQLGKRQRCAPGIATVNGVAVSGGRALWRTSSVGKAVAVDWQLWTATATRRTPHILQLVTRQPTDPPPIVVGAAGGGLLPYSVDATVTTLRAKGSNAF
jgi:hypothetical protein